MNAVASRNVAFISHSDQGGRGDGVQIMVHRGYAYIGHGYSNGITVLDVRDLKNPKPVAFLPCPPWSEWLMNSTLRDATAFMAYLSPVEPMTSRVRPSDAISVTAKAPANTGGAIRNIMKPTS